MSGRRIPQGDYIAPRYAAESYVGREYLFTGDDDGEYSANPADYWHVPDDVKIGAIVRRCHLWVASSGRAIVAPRIIVSNGTMGHLRRLARAAEGLVA